MRTYTGPYGIDDETPTTFMVLPGVGDKDRHVQVFVEDLLYATVIDTLPAVSRSVLSTICWTIFVAKIGFICNVIRGVIAVVCARRRAGFAVDKS